MKALVGALAYYPRSRPRRKAFCFGAWAAWQNAPTTSCLFRDRSLQWAWLRGYAWAKKNRHPVGLLTNER